MDKHPPVTTLTTDPRYADSEVLAELIPSSWLEPFQELLLFLKIILEDSDSDIIQKLCFQHTHDLSELSDVFLDVDVDGVRYSIDLRTFRFPREHQGRTWVMQLEEYANGVLSRFRVSVFTRRAVGTLTQQSDENLGLLQPINRR